MRATAIWKCTLIAVLAACAGAQENAPIGVLRGELLAWTGAARAGEVTFRNADDHVYQCSFDGKTYFERANERIAVSAIRKGDRVEVLADRKDASGLCYARTIHVIDAQPVRALPGMRPRLRLTSNPTELFAPRGDMTFAGMVLGMYADVVILRLRTNEHKTIHLRPDTRYLSEGQVLERSNLEVNTRVFIRAGKNLDDEIEAYQVVWGKVLEP
jgi:hypothetical protein